MKKAKAKKNIFSILCAILGVVFACVMGVTYCVSALNLIYGNNPNSTQAYLANQQYHIINDTLENPVVFGVGTHNFEIAMQYSMPYDFDVCFQYALSWSGGSSTDNVILNFADRDNIICDTSNIYLAKSLTKGDGKKVTFISGVEFVDATDESYKGKTLTITVSNVKIYKKQNSYSDSHYLYNGSVAAQMWLKHKTNAETASIMLYNYRRDYNHGMPYPGSQTTKKQVVTKNTSGEITSTTSTWLGGNRAYAGIGMFIVTGNQPIKLSAQVEGVWYDAGNNKITNSDLISENSIRFNYSSGWSHSFWYNNKMWEERNYDYIIPGNSTCYIELLDSVEITSASKSTDIEYDKYRLVVSEITINNCVFSYSKDEGDFISYNESLDNNTSVSATNNYVQEIVEVVNSSNYSNGLYTTSAGSSLQKFHTSISLINNTANTQTVTLNYNLYYYICNGLTTLTSTENKRAEEYVGTTIDGKVYSAEDAFIGNLYYSYSVEATDYLESTNLTTITIGPYSSVNLLDSYSVKASLQGLLEKTSNNITTSYDVWTYLDVSIKKDNNGNDLIAKETNPSSINLAIEKSKDSSSGNTFISVKNNTTQQITSVQIEHLSVMELNDDAKSFTSINIGNSNLVNEDSFEIDGTTIKSKSSSSIVLFPGDSVQIIKVSSNGNFLIEGVANSANVANPSTAVLTKSGKTDAFIINYSTTISYYVKFSGMLKSSVDGISSETVTETIDGIETSVNYNYYIGILRPGQIISVPMTASGILTATEIETDGNYLESTLTNAGWSSNMAKQMTKYFALVKTTS